jgi:hypothetical protein
MLKSLFLWDFRRGSRQYDVLVALILAFIFLTPRAWFRDQPRPKSVVMLPAEHGATVFWIEADLLAGEEGTEKLTKAQALVRSQSEGKKLTLIRLEPIFDAEQELQGYRAVAKP